jgi:hypothetical protein
MSDNILPAMTKLFGKLFICSAGSFLALSIVVSHYVHIGIGRLGAVA